MFGLGIVGLGAFGEFSLKAYQNLKNCRIVGFHDVSPVGSRLAKELGVKSYASFDKLRKDSQVDIVILNTPNYLHYDQAKNCLSADKHVFCEKPLTLELGQAEELFALAKDKHVVLGSDHPLIFSKIYTRLKRLLDQRVYGEVRSIMVHNLAREGEITTPWFWNIEKSGGWFLNSSYHFIYIANYLLGKGGLVSSSEKIVNGKTCSTELKLSYGNAKVSINHDLMSPNPGCKVVITTTNAQILVNGWVPLKYKIFQKGEIIDSFNTKQNHEEEYLDLIKSCFEDFLNRVSGESFILSDQRILTALDLAIQAQKKARVTLDKVNG
ncbi:MAG: hypothetical protein A2802_02125 [Candidatus Woykebacteria bacterium RIFCSPHIGHO2_01_FULL_43_29]|uniref:Uncharacterized protein n=1 Tax=Candidatus Woykebacteria bacterium RIFCSPLOWO2_01_FULL_43_14 TaxID=1802605 RepID=A0A1G1WUH7_9BACT|nr:MAG: hypothetical protein A2802_02125 [Candidatus Woykebacteria bacterium RIFCSPHIGHO2_01_FULL_43_29]OGY30827.1 MAG: hypothetical protein A3A61_00190 [Candidatus Woykebacteria bacterium RIFCSPLOWO2_01_FULL_43_14]